MSGLLKQRHFRRLWFGEIVSLLGDWLTYVAVSLLALERGQGLFAVAFVLVAHTLPNALLSPIAGSLVDRFDRRTILIATAWARGFLTVGMAAGAMLDSLWTVQGLLLVRTAVSAFYEPAAQSTLPRIVSERQLMPANGILAATWSAMFTFGVAFGGILAAFVGPTTAIAIDAVTFFVAGLILTGLPRVVPERTSESRRMRLFDIGRDLCVAWSYALRRPDLARTVAGKTPVGLATGASWVLLNQVADERTLLSSAAMTLGVMHGVRAIGTGIGPVVWMRFVQQRFGRAPLELTTAVALMGMFTFTWADATWALVTSLLVWGLGSGANWVVTTTRIQSSAPDRYRGRLSATDLFGMELGLTLGALGCAAIAGISDPVTATWIVLAVAGALATAAAVHGRSAIPAAKRALPN